MWAVPDTEEQYIQDIKAVFIYNFTKYIDWADGDTSVAFTICVFGDSQIIEPLREIAVKRRVNGRAIRIQQLTSIDQLDDCHILFIPDSQAAITGNVVEAVEEQNVLVIGEVAGALDRGVMINFVLQQERVKFEINLQAMQESGLVPSSELLKLAVRILE